jgi:murein DD-endopeptidase MepM/ murein hydrolase activator NlpD
VAKPAPFVVPPPASKTSRYVSPVPNLIVAGRGDQGQDYQGKVGSSVVAIGNARIDAIKDDPGGFGKVVYYTLTSGNATGTQIYVGHADPTVRVGQTVAQGAPVATLLQSPGGNATTPGWTEVGIAENGVPKYGMDVGGAMFKKVLGLKLTPTEQAATETYQSTVTAETQAGSPGYVAATTQLAAEKKIAEQTAHLTDPWVVVQRDRAGNPTGFGEAYGAAPPADVLKIGGQPATKSLLNSTWGASYDSIWQDFTGKVATPADIEQVLSTGTSTYALRTRLANAPSFTSSPIYKANAPGIAQQAKQALGTNPPASFVKNAIAENWDAATIDANLRALPQYEKGPAFQADFSQASDTYKSIYGAPKKEQNDWLKQHVLQGWTPDEVAAKLRADPAYKYSPEYASKAISFLDAIGLYTGQRPVAAPAMPAAVAQAGKGSQLGPLPNPFQVSEGGQ